MITRIDMLEAIVRIIELRDAWMKDPSITEEQLIQNCMAVFERLNSKERGEEFREVKLVPRSQ